MLTGILWLLWACESGAAGDAVAAPAPLKAVVAGGTVYTAVGDQSGKVLLWASLDGLASGRCRQPVSFGGPGPAAWDVSFGRFWTSACFSLTPGDGNRTDYLLSAHLDALRLGIAREGPDDAPGGSNGWPHTFANASPLASARVILPRGLYFDYLPASRDSVRLFVLAGHHDPQPPFTVRWSFTVHHYQAKWAADRRCWAPGTWSEEESLPHPFTEPFRVYAADGCYAFVTDSGEVYRTTQKPAKGQRGLARWPPTADRRVVAAVTDADAGKTFLFTAKNGEAGRSKGEYVELAERPAPRAYDLSKLKPTEADPPLREAFDFARVLAADRVLKRPGKPGE